MAAATTDPTAGARVYGVLGRFDEPEALVVAVRRLRAAGYRRLDAFSPYPVEGLAQALGMRFTGVPVLTLLGALAGGALGYFLQYYVAVVDYPINVGGRPLHSWPMFIPITFEMTILGGALAAVFGLLALSRLPQPHHPVFNAPVFARATQDAFFVLVEARDRKFDRERTPRLLLGLGASEVADVPA